MQGKEFYILLDVLFAEVPYVEIIQKEIRNELLTVEEPQIMVSVPSLESILGDKMTAFAPHTKPCNILIGTPSAKSWHTEGLN